MKAGTGTCGGGGGSTGPARGAIVFVRSAGRDVVVAFGAEPGGDAPLPVPSSVMMVTAVFDPRLSVSIRVNPRPVSIGANPRESASHCHSSAPFFQAYAKPTTRMKRKTSISTSPNTASRSSVTAHGNMNTVSTSKMTKSIAIR
jgi:hypothetical protein